MPLFGGSVAEGRAGAGVKAESRFDLALERSSLASRSIREALRERGPSGGGGFQTRDAYEVVGGHRGEEVGSDAAYPSESGLRLAGCGLHPAKDLLDPLPPDLADRVSGVACRPAVDGAATTADVLRDVRSDVSLPKLVDEVTGVVPLVGSEGDPPLAADSLDQLQGRDPLSPPVGLRHGGTDAEPVSVLHECVSEEGHLRDLTVPAAVQLRVGVRRRSVGVVLPFLSLEIDLGVPAPGGGRLAPALLGPEALQGGVGLNHRSVDREVIVGEEPSAPGLLDDLGEEVEIDVGRKEPLAVLREGRRVEGRPNAGQVQEPAKQEVVLEPLAEEAFASNAVERDQDLRFQKHLGWNGLAAPLRVQLPEPRPEPSEGLVGDLLDEADRVIPGNKVFRAHRDDQIWLLLDVSAHVGKVACGGRSVNGFKPIFSAAC